MKVIAEKPWSYVLFDDGEGWVLTFLVGGVVETDISIRLSDDEIAAIRGDTSLVDGLVSAFRQDRNRFAAREINPPVWPQ